MVDGHFTRIHCDLNVLSLGCRDSAPLGLENGFIHDSQITASSSRSFVQGPGLARLSNHQCWRPHATDPNAWLQVDFIAKVIVNKVQTQGYAHASITLWIKTYKLLYGDNGYDFIEYAENGLPKVSSF